MSITAERKKQVVKEYAIHDGDTGSPEVQVAVMSERISNLTDHLKDHPGDKHSRHGLLKMVGRRRRVLDYLNETDEARYKKLIKSLGIRR